MTEGSGSLQACLTEASRIFLPQKIARLESIVEILITTKLIYFARNLCDRAVSLKDMAHGSWWQTANGMLSSAYSSLNACPGVQIVVHERNILSAQSLLIFSSLSIVFR